ncbi:GNAT family N-acetyltransferase [Halobacterium litoreum]|uniref:GNAT family N-acetyltransferase n=1 Tax=Halobacterium litoreum TaxID=2039234 RepID=A0ABD5NG10_9EURY|nr:GNAT family N-acetyltransferase [Halobacterium litoreum]UHH13073.1 GNAT family N-acetyltransferase [Halobacterium litoreum]
MTTVEPAEAGVSIRRATRADLLDVFRIEQAVFEQPWPYSAFEQQVGTPGFLVAEDAHTVESPPPVSGYIVADDIPNHGRPLGHVKDLAVRPERRGEGVGAALLRRGLSALASQGARSVKLEVRESNEPARGLYEKFGFEYLRTLPKYYADGEDAYVLVASLEDRDGF